MTVKKIIRKYRQKTDEECRRDGLLTPLEMVQKCMWFGADTDLLYITHDDIEVEQE